MDPLLAYGRQPHAAAPAEICCQMTSASCDHSPGWRQFASALQVIRLVPHGLESGLSEDVSTYFLLNCNAMSFVWQVGTASMSSMMAVHLQTTFCSHAGTAFTLSLMWLHTNQDMHKPEMAKSCFCCQGKRSRCATSSSSELPGPDATPHQSVSHLDNAGAA